MPRLRDSRGRCIKNIIEQPSSPSSSRETSFETEFNNNPSEPQTMENIGNPPPNHNSPHDNPPRDNPLYANRPL